MAARTATVSRVVPGLSESNRRVVRALAATVADDDTIEVTVDELVGQAWLPVAFQAYTYGAGDVGARTATQVGSEVSLTSHDEATGKTVFTNTHNAGYSNLYIVIEYVAAAN